ncbi:hypothetical protein [Galbitalea soli]|uniref:Uncharacterized protein n=1 Tax=Galbitalea soli TaxID=1268042 RepID=A0A7C9PL02_9MICO|nr:hypothetical protein [Galbitalea soli]NEM89934.1 hypothetical protein [Galbitalea soli]NYJ30640.1 hypothetical protein [Galbitalea soli]
MSTLHARAPLSPTDSLAHPAPSLSARSLPALGLGGTAVLLLTAGAASPWLLLFNGLTTVRGIALDGGPLAVLGLIGLALVVTIARRGDSRVLRVIAALAGGLIAADSLLSAARIGAYVAAPGPAAALTAPSAGVGPWLMAAGGAALLTTAIVVPGTATRLVRADVARVLLAVALIVAAGIHLMLTPEHLGESTLLGAGFFVAGLAQLALAAVVLLRRDDRALGLAITLSIALLAVYAYAVLVGLPLDAGHSEDAIGLRLGAGEPVDLKGLVTVLAEIGTIAAAVVVGRAATPKAE